MSTPHVCVKGKAKLEVIDEVIKFFESRYPDYLEFCKQEIKKLKTVSRAGYYDQQGRYTHVSMKVPTLLFMAIQYILPDFGKTADDIALLTNRIKDLDAHIPMHKERVSLLVPKDFKKKE